MAPGPNRRAGRRNFPCQATSGPQRQEGESARYRPPQGITDPEGGRPKSRFPSGPHTAKPLAFFFAAPRADVPLPTTRVKRRRTSFGARCEITDYPHRVPSGPPPVNGSVAPSLPGRTIDKLTGHDRPAPIGPYRPVSVDRLSRRRDRHILQDRRSSDSPRLAGAIRVHERPRPYNCLRMFTANGQINEPEVIARPQAFRRRRHHSCRSGFDDELRIFPRVGPGGRRLRINGPLAVFDRLPSPGPVRERANRSRGPMIRRLNLERFRWTRPSWNLFPPANLAGTFDWSIRFGREL